MRKVFVAADNIFSPLGKDTFSNLSALKQGHSGIRLHQETISENPFYASLLPPDFKAGNPQLTPFENIVFASASDALKDQQADAASSRTGFILSTTKGNIGLIENGIPDADADRQTGLTESAMRIAACLGIQNEPIIVSHACISGLLAMITGMRMIQSGLYDQVIVSGADLITAFIFSGFQSFQAISPNPCRPFDANRDGITLGEAAATVILSSVNSGGAVQLSGGSVSNDANHISGPSRTGEELFMAIRSALRQAAISAGEIDFISAHGTATRYNDDMEARAINLAGMGPVPLNSLKGFYGHTLGAAGLVESIVSLHSLKENILFPTKGYSEPGTEREVHVIKELRSAKISKCLKTASGFGGCNAAIILENLN
ncbi:MAG: beta-ketoacyl synthase N-terminal-like domain-containing protein [Bacteroidota bacterium]|nr:beta-ketoacyl synthase N-terminal-like domain-containing protein [Bacteroidota bacterium]